MATPPSQEATASAQPTADGPTSGNGDDWTKQVTDLVTDSVDKVRARTTGPLMGIAQGLVYALVAVVVIVPVTVLLFVGLLRLLNWALPGDVWIVYAIIAVVSWIIGAILWTRRDPSEAS